MKERKKKVYESKNRTVVYMVTRKNNNEGKDMF